MESILIADLANKAHADAVVLLLDEYAQDDMGGGEGLSTFTKQNLIGELQRRPRILAILAFIDDNPAGLAICMEGFSTFACKPLLNVHDMVVASLYRGRGLSTRLLAKAEEVANERGCCKLTLEVLECASGSGLVHRGQVLKLEWSEFTIQDLTLLPLSQALPKQNISR